MYVPMFWEGMMSNVGKKKIYNYVLNKKKKNPHLCPTCHLFKGFALHNMKAV